LASFAFRILAAVGMLESALVLGRGKENQDFQLFLNVVEPVLHLGFNKNDRPGLDLGMIGADLHASAPADDVIHLILKMRFLGIDAVLRHHVYPGAHCRNAYEFEVRLAQFRAVAIQIVDMEEVRHEKRTR